MQIEKDKEHTRQKERVNAWFVDSLGGDLLAPV